MVTKHLKGYEVDEGCKWRSSLSHYRQLLWNIYVLHLDAADPFKERNCPEYSLILEDDPPINCGEPWIKACGEVNRDDVAKNVLL